VNSAEIIVREVQSASGLQVPQLLAECIGEPRETAHRHSHGEVLPLNVASRNLIGIRLANANLGI
jgi:hypothetical protein